jgi:hypothetical protein
MDSLCG